jgi:hypothetical protein
LEIPPPESVPAGTLTAGPGPGEPSATVPGGGIGSTSGRVTLTVGGA